LAEAFWADIRDLFEIIRSVVKILKKHIEKNKSLSEGSGSCHA